MNNKILQPAMSFDEIKLFKKIIKDSNYYIEFGSGGSTYTVLELTNAEIFSVESDLFWINELKTNDLIKKSNENERLHFHYIDIGVVEEWGYPINDDKIEDFYKYSSDIFNNVIKDKVDTVFIDGRFRVACTLKSIIELHNNPTIIIHDFINRKGYHSVLKYLDIIDSVDTLYVFKVKKNININDVITDYDRYKYIKE